jgi:hypothetical protein
MTFRPVTQSAAVHNALRALADAVAAELEIHPDCLPEFCEELMCEAGEVCEDVAAGVTPDMLCTELSPPAGDFLSDFDRTARDMTGQDDSNAHGFQGTYETDAAW